MIPEPCRRRKKRKKNKQIKNLTCSAQGRKKFLYGLRLKGGGVHGLAFYIRELLLTKCNARENHFQLQLVLVEWRFIRISYRVNREGLMPTGKKKNSAWSVQLSIGARNQLLLIKIRLSTSKMLVVFFFLSGHVFVYRFKNKKKWMYSEGCFQIITI